MTSSPYRQLAAAWPENEWLQQLCTKAEQQLAGHRHGDLSRWKKALADLPNGAPSARLEGSVPMLGAPADDPLALADILMQLHPWRKGPLNLGGVVIDTEWRSDWKWDRLSPHIDLRGHRVLDIGCGNGYFGWRMLEAGASLVIGIDPTLVFVMQWLACRHFAGEQANYVLPLGIEDLPELPAGVDTVLSMGVLYHRRDAHHHLARLKSLLRPGGTLVLETLVLPESHREDVLVPEGRYARMRNVWALPGTDRLQTWMKRAGFTDVELVDVTPTTVSEQRSTDWMRFESLKKALDPQDESRTVEGLPAPIRAIGIARG